MDITTRTEGRRREVIISQTSDWALFDELVLAISTKFEGDWVERLDGLDERYWDFRFGGASVTLHLQHYLGIILFAEPFAEDRSESEVLIDRIAEFLATYQPQTHGT